MNNKNKWYEVEYIAQDKITISTHYSEDPNRETAYEYLDGRTINYDNL